ncbi:hypothetical protein [Streptomyces sp. NBC_01237]|nr:hypothetical protein [Streptomyces sp. NBC_01237]WRZ77498.1 hypothetical protein OG251_38375 [Streptomyces sp. NBC_01237]
MPRPSAAAFGRLYVVRVLEARTSRRDLDPEGGPARARTTPPG